MDDHPPLVQEALRVLKPHGLVKNIRMVGNRVELVMETGQVLTYPPSSDLSSLKMFELRNMASKAGLVFTNKTTKADLIAAIESVRTLSSSTPSGLDGVIDGVG